MAVSGVWSRVRWHPRSLLHPVSTSIQNVYSRKCEVRGVTLNLLFPNRIHLAGRIIPAAGLTECVWSVGKLLRLAATRCWNIPDILAVARSNHPMSQVPDQHRSEAPASVNCAVVTVSDTRTLETDTGGQTVVDLLEEHGHKLVDRHIIPDEPDCMQQLLSDLEQRQDVDAVLMTGGTGLGSRDQTFETVSQLLTKPLPGYGELFRMLSFDEIGPAAMLSRATGGLLGKTVLLTMPGSRAAVRLAMQKLILPELGHLVREARR